MRDTLTDPITADLMEEPVILPSSGQIVDRSSIVRHLLSDSTGIYCYTYGILIGADPFNRSKLTIDMVKPSKISDIVFVLTAFRHGFERANSTVETTTKARVQKAN